MRESFNELAGSVGDLTVRAIVTQRESDETRSPYVLIEDISTRERSGFPGGRQAW